MHVDLKSKKAWRSTATLAILLGGFLWTADLVPRASAAAGITVEKAWSRATPAEAKVGIGFATIKNGSDEPDKLVSATTEVAGQTQIHEMTMEDGVMKMRQLTDGLPVPAQGEVVLKPGSYHLMLMDLKQPLEAGQHFAGTLTFEKAGRISVTFDVEGMGAKEPGNPHAGH